MRFLFYRSLQLILIMCAVAVISFMLIHWVPGDPIDLMLGENSLELDRQHLREQLKLDQPLMKQFLAYMNGLLHGDWGNSFLTRRPVWLEIQSRWPATMKLSFLALCFALLIAVPAAILASLQRHKLLDRCFFRLSLLGQAIPTFWLGPLLVFIFALQFRWLPVSGNETWGHWILPALTLGIPVTSLLFRILRASLADVIEEDFIRTARAKGLSRGQTYWRHALKPALLPLLTTFSMVLASLLTGSVIVETIFDWPGMGTLVFEAIQNRDYPLIQGSILFLAWIVLVVQAMNDCLYRWLNPRVDLS